MKDVKWQYTIYIIYNWFPILIRSPEKKFPPQLRISSKMIWIYNVKPCMTKILSIEISVITQEHSLLSSQSFPEQGLHKHLIQSIKKESCSGKNFIFMHQYLWYQLQFCESRKPAQIHAAEIRKSITRCTWFILKMKPEKETTIS